jgi:multiple sugar transport system permease protein/raffinose/stachyose/melibiose transport system permease protein
MKNSFSKRSQYSGVDFFSSFTLIFLGFWVVFTIVPILHLIGLSLRSALAVGDNILYIIPRQFTLKNYVDAFPFFSSITVSLPRAFINSAIYTFSGIVGSIIIAVLASFAFATMKFRGKKFIFSLLLLCLVMPTSAMLLPEYITVGTLGLKNTMWGLILPYIAFSMSLPILVMTSFFKQIPQELYDAAQMDGCTPFKFLYLIGLPMARPALATCIIWTFINLWNEFPLALVLLVKKDMYNLPVALLSMNTAHGVNPWDLISAVMIMASIPIIITFILFQNYFIEGLTEGALKG